jgi:hypothetical protein
VATDMLGYKGFVSYDVVKNFFAYGEFDRNLIGAPKLESLNASTWKNAAFIGVGKKFRVHPKVEMTSVVVYNLLFDYPDPVYPKRWNFRVGVQRSLP